MSDDLSAARYYAGLATQSARASSERTCHAVRQSRDKAGLALQLLRTPVYPFWHAPRSAHYHPFDDKLFARNEGDLGRR